MSRYAPSVFRARALPTPSCRQSRCQPEPFSLPQIDRVAQWLLALSFLSPRFTYNVFSVCLSPHALGRSSFVSPGPVSRRAEASRNRNVRPELASGRARKRLGQARRLHGGNGTLRHPCRRRKGRDHVLGV